MLSSLEDYCRKAICLKCIGYMLNGIRDRIDIYTNEFLKLSLFNRGAWSSNNCSPKERRELVALAFNYKLPTGL